MCSNKFISGIENALHTKLYMAAWNVTLAQLPQTIHYQNASILAEDAALYRNLTRMRFSLASRDLQGVAIAKSAFEVPVYACPDLAFLLGPAQASPWCSHSGRFSLQDSYGRWPQGLKRPTQVRGIASQSACGWTASLTATASGNV